MDSDPRSRAACCNTSAGDAGGEADGHKDPSSTIKAYTPWLDDAEDKNRDAMDDLAAAMLTGGSKTVAVASA